MAKIYKWWHDENEKLRELCPLNDAIEHLESGNYKPGTVDRCLDDADHFQEDILLRSAGAYYRFVPD